MSLVCSPAEVAINVSLYKSCCTIRSRICACHPRGVGTSGARRAPKCSGAFRSGFDQPRALEARPADLRVIRQRRTAAPAGELFKLMARVDMVHVPYKGGAPAITDLVGGHVQLFFAGLPASASSRPRKQAACARCDECGTHTDHAGDADHRRKRAQRFRNR